MNQRSRQILKKQKLILIAFLSVLFVVVFLIYFFMFETDYSPKPAPPKKIDLPMDNMSAQEMWNSRAETDMKIFKKKMDYMENLLLENKKYEEEQAKEKASLTNELSKLKEELKKTKEEARRKPEPIAYNEPPKQQENPLFSQTMIIDNPQPTPIRTPLAIQTATPSENKIQHVDKVIPSGTTVKAVLVSSVDAPCGAYSSSDPQPVKLQILDDGHLPKKVRARLKGGIIIASVYGDLSSERIYVRLERLTQVKPSGNFVETSVTGFVTGEDGKYGVRGTVVDKSAKLVENAALSGLFSGVNSFFQAYAASRFCNFGYGYGCGPCGNWDDGNKCSSKEFAYGLAAEGGTQGLGNSFDMLTDYYIKRAELIKPIIQVNAGRIVDITFTYGTEIGDIHTQEKVKDLRISSRERACTN